MVRSPEPVRRGARIGGPFGRCIATLGPVSVARGVGLASVGLAAGAAGVVAAGVAVTGVGDGVAVGSTVSAVDGAGVTRSRG